jgi:hypothetical protein
MLCHVHRAEHNVGRLLLDLNRGLGRQQVGAQMNDAEIRLIDPGDALQEHRD